MLRPRDVDLHFEVELAVVLGREVRDFMEDGGIGNGNGNGEGGGGGRWMDFIDCMCAFCVFCVFRFFPLFCIFKRTIVWFRLSCLVVVVVFFWPFYFPGCEEGVGTFWFLLAVSFKLLAVLFYGHLISCTFEFAC